MMVLAMVLMCQVVGALCPPVSSAFGGAEAIRSTHTGHQMDAMNMCQDSIPSSFTSIKSLESSSISLHDSTPFALHGLQVAGIHDPAGPLVAGKGHSIFSRLSIFRI